MFVQIVQFAWKIPSLIALSGIFQDPTDQITGFICDIQGILMAISGSVAVIGILGLGMMYIGSSLPLISEWKQNNPKAFQDVTWGIIFLIFASGGGVIGLLGGNENLCGT